jgi:hypothetical protein
MTSARSGPLRRTAALLAGLLLGACTLSPALAPTQPSGVTQQLMRRSLNAPPTATARAKLDKFTVLLIFGFTLSDVDEHE